MSTSAGTKLLSLFDIRTRSEDLTAAENAAGELVEVRREIADLAGERRELERQTASRRESVAATIAEARSLADAGRARLGRAMLAEATSSARRHEPRAIRSVLREGSTPVEVLGVCLAFVGDAVVARVVQELGAGVPEGLDAAERAEAIEAIGSRIFELEHRAETLCRLIEASTARYVERHEGADPRAVLAAD